MFARATSLPLPVMLLSVWLLAPASPVASGAHHAADVLGLEFGSHISIPRTVRVRQAGRIATVPLEDYVVSSALTEVSPVGETPEVIARIFEVQTVLARSYVVANRNRHGHEGFDVCDGTHCQLYEPKRLSTSRFADAARAAAEATRGRVLMFGSRVARALFHADCGGHTIAANAVWRGAPVKYLVGAPDDAPDVVHRTWSFDVSSEQLRSALNEQALSTVGATLTHIEVAERDDSGRASRVKLEGSRNRTVSGLQLRSLVNAEFGPKAIQSTLFDVIPTNDGFRFQGSGFGHGVGLCQIGAAARARRGESLADILAVYFPGARLL